MDNQVVTPTQPTSDLRTAANATFTKPFGAVLEIRPSDAPAIYIDGHNAPPTISDTPLQQAADCVWHADDDVLGSVLRGERALDRAFISGRLVITGDMSVMARLNLETAR